jgi:hypothetical protein
MAKISTYPIVGSPTLSDILIGTDVADSNNTKNFSIGSMLALVNDPSILTDFVPYTGATQDVDLGPYDLTVGNLLKTQQLWVEHGFYDSNAFVGTNGQLLGSFGGLTTVWTTVDLDYILGQGNSSTNNIVLAGSASVSAPTVEATQTLIVGGELEDSNSSIGTAGQILSSTGAATEWVDAEAAFTSYRGSFYSLVDQTLVAANTAKAIVLGTTDVAATNGVSITSDGANLTRITFAHAGVYNVMFSAQLENSGGSSQTVDFWLRKNGLILADNVPNTNGKVQLQSNTNHLMAAWNYFVDVNAGDFIHLMFAATSTNVSLVHEAASGPHPVTPSVIVTVNKV